MGTPGKEPPASTMKLFPDTYSDKSWIRYRMMDVIAGLVVPYVFRGLVLSHTRWSHSFSISADVISDLNTPGAIEFVRMPNPPSSIANTWIWYFILMLITKVLEIHQYEWEHKKNYPCKGSNTGFWRHICSGTRELAPISSNNRRNVDHWSSQFGIAHASAYVLCDQPCTSKICVHQGVLLRE
jgi:hypothetical protein